MTDHKPMPVAGYTEQSDLRVATVNAMKQAEEGILRALDILAEKSDIDKRWLSIGRTHIEQGFMAVNRSVFRPQRIKLDD